MDCVPGCRRQAFLIMAGCFLVGALPWSWLGLWLSGARGGRSHLGRELLVVLRDVAEHGLVCGEVCPKVPPTSVFDYGRLCRLGLGRVPDWVYGYWVRKGGRWRMLGDVWFVKSFARVPVVGRAGSCLFAPRQVGAYCTQGRGNYGLVCGEVCLRVPPTSVPDSGRCFLVGASVCC